MLKGDSLKILVVLVVFLVFVTLAIASVIFRQVIFGQSFLDGSEKRTIKILENVNGNVIVMNPGILLCAYCLRDALRIRR